MRWRVPPRVLLIGIGLAAVALVVIRVEGAQDDWAACYRLNTAASANDPAVTGNLRGERPSGGAVVTVIGSMLLLLVVAIVKSLVAQWIAFLAVLLPLLFVVGPMHACDRQGCEVCGAIWFWALYIEIPLAILMLALSVSFAVVRGARSYWRR